MLSDTNAKKKYRQYSQEHLKHSFVPSFANETIPMCLLCGNTFSNDAIKPAEMREHLKRIHSDKNKDVGSFQMLRQKL